MCSCEGGDGMTEQRKKSDELKNVLNKEQLVIAQWLEKVCFKKVLFGVSEADVWKKIAELDGMYQQALKAERVRYDTLLEEYKKNMRPAVDIREVKD